MPFSMFSLKAFLIMRHELDVIIIDDYPPWSVDTNRMLSPFFSSYEPSPSSSQSASLIRTSMPGRLRYSLMNYQFWDLQASLHGVVEDKEVLSVIGQVVLV